jgi:pilus assembly protein CpaB
MWEVKRMNRARIVVLVLALGAGGVAAWLASGTDRKPEPAPTAQMETVDVLVAKSDLPLGQSLSADDMQWQNWPAGTVSPAFIRRNANPNAVAEFTGSIVRSTFFAGEPIREAKLVKANGSGFMAAILPSGMRAVSTEISPETGAGGFILPNDRVDVLLTIRSKDPDRKSAADTVNAEVVLTNVRVLAIDQTIEEKNGQKVVVGKTATLELKPEQTETLARARQSGTLSLALRSIADANAAEQQNSEEGRRRRQDTINVVRYGVTAQTTTQK